MRRWEANLKNSSKCLILLHISISIQLLEKAESLAKQNMLDLYTSSSKQADDASLSPCYAFCQGKDEISFPSERATTVFQHFQNLITCYSHPG